MELKRQEGVQVTSETAIAMMIAEALRHWDLLECPQRVLHGELVANLLAEDVREGLSVAVDFI